jgi:hypothetical protein
VPGKNLQMIGIHICSINFLLAILRKNYANATVQAVINTH